MSEALTHFPQMWHLMSDRLHFGITISQRSFSPYFVLFVFNDFDSRTKRLD